MATFTTGFDIVEVIGSSPTNPTTEKGPFVGPFFCGAVTRFRTYDRNDRGGAAAERVQWTKQRGGGPMSKALSAAEAA